MSLLKTPTEVLYLIANHLTRSTDLNAFSRACRWTHVKLSYLLYQRLCSKHRISDLTDWAIYHGRLETLVRAQSAGIDLFRPGIILLALAIEENQIKIVKWALKQVGELINEKDDRSGTPLMAAARNGNLEIVKLLLEHGADVSLRDDRSGSALLYGAKSLKPKGLERLIKNGGDVTHKFNNGQDIVYAAASSNCLDTVKLLVLKYGMKISTTHIFEENPLYPAIQSSNVEILRLLLDKGASMNFRAWEPTLLNEAIVSNRAEPSEALVRLILERKAPGLFMNHYLDLATQKNFLGAVQALLEFGADVKACSRYGNALLTAVQHNAYKYVKLFLEKCAKIYESTGDKHFVKRRRHSGKHLRRHPVVEAAALPEPRILELLLAHGGELSVRNGLGRTPLIAAAASGHASVVRFLVGRKVDLEAKDNYGHTALWTAASHGTNRVAAAYLMENGASCNTFPWDTYANRLTIDYEKEYEREMALEGGPSDNILNIVLSRHAFGGGTRP